MMYLNKISLLNNITSQVKWKMVTYSNILTLFIFVQIIFSLLFTHSGMSGSGLNNMELREYIYSLDAVFMVSAVSALFIGFTLATKRLDHDNFSIPTTRFSANISTIIFLCIVSFFAAITAISTHYMTLFGKMLILDYDIAIGAVFPNVTTFCAMCMIILFATAVGFFTGSVYKLSRILAIFLGVGSFVLFIRYVPTERSFFIWLFDKSYNALILKTFLLSFLLYSLACIITNRMEVRRG